MTKKEEALIALVQVDDTSMLCTTKKQDLYYLRRSNGRTEKVDLLTATRLYLRATKGVKENLLWGRSKAPTARASRKPSDAEARTKKWREQMEKTLGRKIED